MRITSSIIGLHLTNPGSVAELAGMLLLDSLLNEAKEGRRLHPAAVLAAFELTFRVGLVVGIGKTHNKLLNNRSLERLA